MGLVNGQITAPVSLQADVYAALGLQKTGTYYDIGYICSNRHGRTNMWSRRKPVRYPGPAELTEAQWKTACFGMDVKYSANLDTAIEAAKAGDWGYLPPRPGTDWCRLTDWVGYRHNAVRPCTTKLMDQAGERGQSALGMVMFQDTTGEAAATQGNLSLREMMVNGVLFSNCYFCVVVIDGNGNKVIGSTSEKPFGQSNNTVYFSYDQEIAVGKYTMIPLISSVSRQDCRFYRGETWSGGWYATLPTKPGTLTVREWSDVDFTCVATWTYKSNGRRNSINFEFYWTNRSGAAVNIGRVRARAGYIDDRQDPPANVYLWNYDVNGGNAITIPAGVEDEETRMGGVITPDMMGLSAFNERDSYFVELIFETTYVEDWVYEVQ